MRLLASGTGSPGARSAGAEAAAFLRRRPHALRGPRPRLRVQHPPKGDGWDLSGLSRAATTPTGSPSRSPIRARGGGLSAVASHAAPATRPRAGDPRPRPLGLSRLRPVRDRRGPAGDPRRRPDPLPARVLGASRLLRDPVRGRPGRDLRDRYDETVGRWDAGLALPSDFARPLVAGTLRDGRAAVLWASESANPRPDVLIASVTLVARPDH